YLEIVREAFAHTLDEDVGPEEVAEEVGVTPHAAARALARIRALGLLDLSRLARSDPLTSAEAMSAPWLAGVGESDRAVLRYLLAHPGTPRHPTTGRTSQAAHGGDEDRAQPRRIEHLLRPHP